MKYDISAARRFCRCARFSTGWTPSRGAPITRVCSSSDGVVVGAARVVIARRVRIPRLALLARPSSQLGDCALVDVHGRAPSATPEWAQSPRGSLPQARSRGCGCSSAVPWRGLKEQPCCRGHAGLAHPGVAEEAVGPVLLGEPEALGDPCCCPPVSSEADTAGELVLSLRHRTRAHVAVGSKLGGDVETLAEPTGVDQVVPRRE